MSFDVCALHLLPYALPFGRVLRTAAGSFSHRRGWLLAIDDERGRRGWGDAAPWPGFGSSELRVASELCELSQAPLIGAHFDDAADVWRFLDEIALAPEVRYALELALLDLLGQASQTSLAHMLAGGDASTSAATHALVVGKPDRRARYFKLKIGSGDLDADEQRVAALRAAVGPAAILRLDAGGAFDLDTASRALERLSRYDIAWLEQPLAREQIEATAILRQRARELGCAIALDESIGSASDLDAVIEARAADAVVLKPMFVGGVGRARALAAKARDAGLTAIVTNALESAVGRAGTLHLAAALEGVHGLGSALARDLADCPKRIGDRIALPPGFGLGVAVHAEFVAQHDVPLGPSSRAVREATAAIPNPLRSASLARPHHPAVVTAARSLTYRELQTEVSEVAGGLRARGIAPGMTVALVGPRNADWVIAFHAIGWLGASVAPLPERAPTRERDRLLDMLAPHVTIDTSEPLSRAAELDERFWPPSETRTLITTSGTSAAARPVSLTTNQLLLSAFGSAIRLGHHIDDRWLCCLPLNHVAGVSVLMRCALYGITAVLHERFDPARVAAALDDGDVSMVSLVPSMLEQLLDARAEQPFPPSLRTILVGGAAASERLLARCRELGAPVALTWGMTEAASQIATRVTGDLAVDGGVGAPLPFARVESRDGRLWVRGPLVAGSLATADAGELDDDGRVVVLGRADDVVVSGGEKIAPREVEEILEEHPAVAEAVVVGIESAAWGARPVAALVAAGDNQPSDAELSNWCRPRLASFKLPDHYIWCARLPKGELGKRSRARVRELVREVVAERTPSVVEQLELTQSSEQPIWRGGRLEPVERHHGVHERSGRTHAAVVSAQHVGEGDGALAQLGDRQLDIDAVVETDGPLEVGLRVHERQAETVSVDQPIDVVTSSQQHLLEGGVTELEHTPEEDDPCAIHLVEARGHSMNERHDDERR